MRSFGFAPDERDFVILAKAGIHQSLPLLRVSSLLLALLLFEFLGIRRRLGGVFPPVFGWAFFVLVDLFIADGNGVEMRSFGFAQDDGVGASG